MEGLGAIILLVVMIGGAVVVLKGFDRISGRGPKQVSDGIKHSGLVKSEVKRIPCPHCAEMIIPTAKKCRFCQTELHAANSELFRFEEQNDLKL